MQHIIDNKMELLLIILHEEKSLFTTYQYLQLQLIPVFYEFCQTCLVCLSSICSIKIFEPHLYGDSVARFRHNLKYNVFWLNILLKRAFDYLTVAFDGLKWNETIYKLCDEMWDQAGSN